MFMGCLGSCGFRHFKIHLSATESVRISASVTLAHTDGKMKILCSEYRIGVLAFLTDLANFPVE